MTGTRTYLLFGLLLSAFLSGNAWGFALGSISVTSSFNKVFSADIPVKLDGPMPLTVRVGNGEDYDRLDLYRTPLLDTITVSVKRVSATEATLHFESLKPLLLSSLNLLVRCVHNGGTIYENFVVAADFRKQLSLNLPGKNAKKAEDKTRRGGTLQEDVAKPVPEKEKVSGEVIRAPIAREFEREFIDVKTLKDRSRKREYVSKQPAPKKNVTSEEEKKREYYKVMKGDTLYEIAKKIGATSKRIESYVVDIWRKNSDKFFKRNMNYLAKGVNLDVTGVSENRISRREAVSVIRGQWKELTGNDFFRKRGASGASRVNVIELPLPYEKNFWDINRIAETVKEWKRRWESADIDSFMAMYSKRFRRGIYHYKSWRSFKRAFNARHRKFTVVLHDIKVRIEKNMASASFLQEFTSPRMHTRGTKTLSFVKEGGNYKIAGEVWQREIQREGRRPYVVHVSSFRTHELAIKEVNLLRKKGYSAYEILSDVGARGAYYRVVIDRFSTEAEAVSFARKITGKKIVDYGKPLKMPLAIEVGSFQDRAEALKRILELRKFFFSPYPLVKCAMNQCYYQILIGAYKDKKSALPVSGKLTGQGFENRVIRP